MRDKRLYHSLLEMSADVYAVAQHTIHDKKSVAMRRNQAFAM